MCAEEESFSLAHSSCSALRSAAIPFSCFPDGFFWAFFCLLPLLRPIQFRSYSLTFIGTLFFIRPFRSSVVYLRGRIYTCAFEFRPRVALSRSSIHVEMRSMFKVRHPEVQGPRFLTRFTSEKCCVKDCGGENEKRTDLGIEKKRPFSSIY